MTEVISVKFKDSGKSYYFSPDKKVYNPGENVIVETANGLAFGTVCEGNHEVSDDRVVSPLKKVLRVANEKDMRKLEENIKHYMELKGIRFYTELLVDIAHHLNIRGNDAYKFADREKANFSKMLKGERPLKYEFIIPLEQIFGVSLARMINRDAYKLPLEKENVPFDKGFRYYAYVDNPELYKKELAVLLTKSGESVLSQTDEFEKTFLDYVVEYNAINGIRFLHDNYHLKIRFYNNQFDTEPKGIFWVHDKGIELARMISNMGDVELFNDIYDSRYMMASSGYYLPETIFAQDEFAEIVLDNKELLKSIYRSLLWRKKY